jgi:hypothetical protein
MVELAVVLAVLVAIVIHTIQKLQVVVVHLNLLLH